MHKGYDGKTKEKKLLGRLGDKCGDNIKTDFTEIGREECGQDLSETGSGVRPGCFRHDNWASGTTKCVNFLLR
jgi:hypothetical protein